MKVKQLPNSDNEVDHESRLLGPELESAVGAARLGQIDLEHDAVYFGGDSSPESFSGHLSYDLDDDEVIEFIRRANLALYDSLWSSPSPIVKPAALAATVLPGLSDGAAIDPTAINATNVYQRDTAAASSKASGIRTRPSASNTPSRAPARGRDVLGHTSSNEAARTQSTSVSRSQNELQQDLYLLQLRRYVQSLLLHGHILVLQKVPPADAKVRSRSCDHPLCKYRHGIPAGAYRLSLESRRTLEKPIATADKYHSPKDEDGGKYLKVRSMKSRGFYCLTCLEDLFSGVGMLDDDYTSRTSVQQASPKTAGPASAPIAVDGSFEENIELRPIVLQAAEKLLPHAGRVNEAQLRRHARPQTPSPTFFDEVGGRGTFGTASDNELTLLDPTSVHDHCEGDQTVRPPSNSDQAILLRDAKRQETDTTLQLLCQVVYRQEVRQLSHSYSMGELPSLKISRPTDLPRRQERYKKQGLTEYNRRLWRNVLPATHFQDSSIRTTSELVGEMESANAASDELSTDETAPFSDDESVDPTYTIPMTPHRQSKPSAQMTFTPYEFLDGAGEGQSDTLDPHNILWTTSTGVSIPDTPLQTKTHTGGARTSLIRSKRGSIPVLQSADNPSTPTKRLKRSKSPPAPLTPPPRHIKTSFGHLAPFIYPETRTSAAALSNPQIIALEKWKSIHLYSPLTEIMKSSKPGPANSSHSCTTSQQEPTTSNNAPNIATLDFGGIVVHIPSVQGKKLSQVLAEADDVVESELRKRGSTGWEQGVPAREEAVKMGKAKSSQIDEQNGVTSPKAANEVRRRISKFFSRSMDKAD